MSLCDMCSHDLKDVDNIEDECFFIFSDIEILAEKPVNLY